MWRGLVAELHLLSAEPPGKDVLAIIKEVLAEAEAGRLSSVAIAVVYRDGATGNCWSSPPNAGLQIGAVATLQAKLMRAVIE
jgi:hypothetical protein